MHSSTSRDWRGKESRRILVVTLAVLALALFAAAFATYLSFRSNYTFEHDRAALNSKVYAERVQQDLERGIAITESLEVVIVDNGGGTINGFDVIAANLMEDYIGSIQLAPAGTVTDIYPMAGNEAGLIDLFADPDRSKVCQYAVDNDTVTMQGPFNLKQGGQGIAVRNPVFVDGADGTRTFWGFTIVIIKVPDIYADSVSDLNSFGYQYTLDATVLPLTGEPKQVATSLAEGESLVDAQSTIFTEGGCTWTLSVATQKAKALSAALPMGVGSLILAVLITVMAYLLMARRRYQSQLQASYETEKRAAEVDALTGLYNRRMCTSALAGLELGEHEFTCIVNVDVNGLKAVNDSMGHVEGDELIRAAARCIRSVFDGMGTCYRTGGDEFVVIVLDRECDKDDLRAQIRAAAKGQGSAGVQELSVSVGIALSSDPRVGSVQDMVEIADVEMYADKRLYYARRGNDRRRLGSRVSKVELSSMVAELGTVFDVVRVVDLEQKRAVRYDENGEEHFDEMHCFEIWGKGRQCDNCISAKVMSDRGRHSKFEVKDGVPCYVISQYVDVDGSPVLLEVVSRFTDALSYDDAARERLCRVFDDLR